MSSYICAKTSCIWIATQIHELGMQKKSLNLGKPLIERVNKFSIIMSSLSIVISIN